MKKLLSLALALILVLSMSTVAFAEGEAEATPNGGVSTVTLTKTYTAPNGGTSPAETFSFEKLKFEGVTNAGVDFDAANVPMPVIGTVTYTAGEAGSGTATKDITITLPEYNAVGVYTYTFYEVDGGTAGVTYRTDAIKLVVTVIEQGGKVRVAAVHTEGANDTSKSDKFDNVYNAGTLAVTKTVTGNMGDLQKPFTVKVTFTAPEGDTVREAITYTDDGKDQTIAAGEEGWTGSKYVEITLKNGETVKFENIPYGVSYTVEENDYTGEGYDEAKYDNKNGVINADSPSVTTTITNNKGGTVDTGISMDSLPYVMLLAVACIGMVAFISKKRMARDF